MLPVVTAIKSIFKTKRELQLLMHLPGLETQAWHVDSIEQAEHFAKPFKDIPTDFKNIIYSVFIAFSNFKINLSKFLDFDKEEIVGKQLVEVKRGSILVITGHTAHAGNCEDASVFRATSTDPTNQVQNNNIIFYFIVLVLFVLYSEI